MREDFTLSNSASSFPRRRTVVAGIVQSAFGILGVRMQRKAAWKEVGRGLALLETFCFTVFVFSSLSKLLCCHIVNSYYGASMQRGSNSSLRLRWRWITLNAWCALTFNAAKGLVHLLLGPELFTHCGGNLPVCQQAKLGVMSRPVQTGGVFAQQPGAKRSLLLLWTLRPLLCVCPEIDNLRKDKLSQWRHVTSSCPFRTSSLVFPNLKGIAVAEKCPVKGPVFCTFSDFSKRRFFFNPQKPF